MSMTVAAARAAPAATKVICQPAVPPMVTTRTTVAGTRTTEAGPYCPPDGGSGVGVVKAAGAAAQASRRQVIAADARARTPPRGVSRPGGQPHCELVAFVKLFTEFFTLEAFWVAVMNAAADGLDDRVVTELVNAPTDEVIALV